MGLKFANNAYGVLDSGISDVATTLDLTANGALFPEIVLASGDYFYATITKISGVREIIKVTHHTSASDTFQVFLRAQDGTSPVAFSAGDKVQIRFPKVILEEIQADIASNLADIATNASDLSDYETSNDIDIAALQAFDAAAAVLAAPSGLTLWMYNPSGEIPTGWGAKAGPADALLAVAGGSEAYDVAGENLAGSWTPTGHVHTIGHLHTITHTHDMSHTHAGGSMSLSSAQMPAHTHVGETRVGTAGKNGLSGTSVDSGTQAHLSVTSVSGQAWKGTTGSKGSGSSHDHGNTVSQSTPNTGASSAANTGAVDTADSGSSKEPSTDRPYAAVGLLIERD